MFYNVLYNLSLSTFQTIKDGLQVKKIAHIRERDGQIQTVEQHLLETKELAEKYGERLGIKHLTGLAGLLHDVGKFSKAFQDYIIKAVNDPDSAPKRGSVDHSTAGGKLLYEYFHSKKVMDVPAIVAEVVGNAIFAHHSYLLDYLNPDLESDYLKRARKDVDEYAYVKECFFTKVMDESTFADYVNQAVNELERFLTQESQLKSEMKITFLTKWVFSTLIDADRTSTRLFEEGQQIVEDNEDSSLWNVYYERLVNKLHSFPVNTKINRLRHELSDKCEDFADKPSGIYTLSMPTGSGKTLASLRYALKHAMLHNKLRIIYVLPYTTIIEQNAAEVRSILQDPAHILEHHSNVIVDDDSDDFIHKRLKLAKDDWDAPIIFTTMVQFLNVFYAKGTRYIRRLHRLSDAVMIFDEVQQVPVSCVSLFNQALNFLNKCARSSILLCTATQPALDYVEQKLEIGTDAEIIQQQPKVIQAFQRVKMIDRATEEEFDNDKLANFIHEQLDHVKSLLVILNTKAVVRNLYHHLKQMDLGVPIYHLSTAMCAAHRKQILTQIKAHLAKQEKVVCISTQLIEAGVDISFHCVIRSLAGLDSLAQAAGRCNRHGELSSGNVYLIDHREENLQKLPEIETGKRIAKRILIDIKRGVAEYNDLLSSSAINRYFQAFYREYKTHLNYFIPPLEKYMTELLFSSRDDHPYLIDYRAERNSPFPLFLPYSYGTAAKYFRVIDQPTIPVLVPYKEGKEMIAELNGNGSLEKMSTLLRRAQQYTVNLYDYEKQLLIQQEGLTAFFDGRILALKEGAYHQEYGVDVQNDARFDALLI